MAYCQSQLYVEYLKPKYGPKVGRRDAGRLRATASIPTAALQKVCKVDKAAFEKGYRAYLDEVVKAIKGKPAARRR